MNELLREYKKRWYLFLICVLTSWLSLAISFYTPVLFSLAIGFIFSDGVLLILSLILFILVAPLPIHLLNRKLSKNGLHINFLLLYSIVSAVVLSGVAMISFSLLSGNIDWGSGNLTGFGMIVTAFVVLFWVVALLIFAIRFIVKGIKSLRKKGSISVVLVIMLLLTAWSGNTEATSNLTLDSRWNVEYFSHTRQAVNFSEDTPYGYLSVPLIRHMSYYLYERSAFTYRELESAVWIVEELLAMGHTWDNIEIQEFSWSDFGFRSWLEHGRFNGGFVYFIGGWLFSANEVIITRFFSNQEHRANMVSQNVVLTIPGQTDEFIVIGAHYDTVLYPGANDNASGTALLLESARRMMYQDNYHTLVYVFFGAHEGPLFGARHFVYSMTDKEHDNLLFMINADVLIGSEFTFYHAGFNDNGIPGANAITVQIDNIADYLNDYHDMELFSSPHGIYTIVDSTPFLRKGHTIVFLASHDWYSVQHTELDNWGFLNEIFPGMIENNMRDFSIFLENLLLSRY